MISFLFKTKYSPKTVGAA